MGLPLTGGKRVLAMLDIPAHRGPPLVTEATHPTGATTLPACRPDSRLDAERGLLRRGGLLPGPGNARAGST